VLIDGFKRQRGEFPAEPGRDAQSGAVSERRNRNQQGWEPVAALVDAELFVRIRRMQERFDALSQRLADAYSDVPMQEGLAEIDAAVKKARRR
jgi:hypothetical protein